MSAEEQKKDEGAPQAPPASEPNAPPSEEKKDEQPPAAKASDAPPKLRDDGPTLEEFVNAGYKARRYPPNGYAEKPSSGLDAYKKDGTVPPRRPSQAPKVQQPPAQRQRVIDTTQPASSPVRPNHTRVKILSTLRIAGSGDIESVLLLPGSSAEVPDSVVADPLLAHCFEKMKLEPAPRTQPRDDSPDGGSPGFEPPLAADDSSKGDAAKAGY